MVGPALYGFFKEQLTEAKFLVPDWGMKPAMASLVVSARQSM